MSQLAWFAVLSLSVAAFAKGKPASFTGTIEYHKTALPLDPAGALRPDLKYHVNVGNGYSCTSGAETESPVCVPGNPGIPRIYAVVTFDNGSKENWTATPGVLVDGHATHNCLERYDSKAAICGVLLFDGTQTSQQFQYTVDKHGKIVSAFAGTLPVLAE